MCLGCAGRKKKRRSSMKECCWEDRQWEGHLCTGRDAHVWQEVCLAHLLSLSTESRKFFMSHGAKVPCYKGRHVSVPQGGEEEGNGRLKRRACFSRARASHPGSECCRQARMSQCLFLSCLSVTVHATMPVTLSACLSLSGGARV